MVKINNYSIEFWSDQETWFIRYPDGSGESIFGCSLRYVMYRVLYLISKGVISIFQV